MATNQAPETKKPKPNSVAETKTRTTLRPKDVFKYEKGMHVIQINVHDMENNQVAKEIMDMVALVVGSDNSTGLKDITTGVQSETPKTDAVKAVFTTVKDFAVSLDKYISQGDFISNLGEPIEVLWLPVPNVMREVHHQLYEDSSYNLEDRMLKGGFSAIQAGLTKVNGKYGGNASGLMENLAELTQHVMRRSNINIDPNNVLVYDGSSPRTYTFSFNIVPENEKQAEYYTQVVEKLKIYSLASRLPLKDVTEGVSYNIIRQAHLFSFNFLRIGNTIAESAKKNKHLETLFSNDPTITKGFALSNVTSTVGNDGILAYTDGSPKIITLSLTFTERKPLWEDELSEYYRQALKKY